MLDRESDKSITIITIDGCESCVNLINNVNRAVRNHSVKIDVVVKNYKEFTKQLRKLLKLKDFPVAIFRVKNTETFRFTGCTAEACIARYIDLYLKHK